jgi:predicted solute-binding protein
LSGIDRQGFVSVWFTKTRHRTFYAILCHRAEFRAQDATNRAVQRLENARARFDDFKAYIFTLTIAIEP